MPVINPKLLQLVLCLSPMIFLLLILLAGLLLEECGGLALREDWQRWLRFFAVLAFALGLAAFALRDPEALFCLGPGYHFTALIAFGLGMREARENRRPAIGLAFGLGVPALVYGAMAWSIYNS